jgi:hypothetical protein
MLGVAHRFSIITQMSEERHDESTYAVIRAAIEVRLLIVICVICGICGFNPASDFANRGDGQG